MVQKLVLMHFQESNMVVHGGQLPRKNHSFSDSPGSRGLSSHLQKLFCPPRSSGFAVFGCDRISGAGKQVMSKNPRPGPHGRGLPTALERQIYSLKPAALRHGDTREKRETRRESNSTSNREMVVVILVRRATR